MTAETLNAIASAVNAITLMVVLIAVDKRVRTQRGGGPRPTAASSEPEQGAIEADGTIGDRWFEDVRVAVAALMLAAIATAAIYTGKDGEQLTPVKLVLSDVSSLLFMLSGACLRLGAARVMSWLRDRWVSAIAIYGFVVIIYVVSISMLEMDGSLAGRLMVISLAQLLSSVSLFVFAMGVQRRFGLNGALLLASSLVMGLLQGPGHTVIYALPGSQASQPILAALLATKAVYGISLVTTVALVAAPLTRVRFPIGVIGSVASIMSLAVPLGGYIYSAVQPVPVIEAESIRDRDAGSSREGGSIYEHPRSRGGSPRAGGGSDGSGSS
ncbi:MAG: hypothetical protein AAGG07_14200 [Planctomycetota bacterium]